MTAALALRVIILTPEVHKYLTRRKPEALAAAIAALHDNLPADEWQRLQQLLAPLDRNSSKVVPRKPDPTAPQRRRGRGRVIKPESEARKRVRLIAVYKVDPAIIELLQDAQGDNSLRTFARKIGVSAEHISQIYHGKAKPGERVMRFLNLY